MQICGREFDRATIARIEEMTRASPPLSRRALSRRVCEDLQWRAPNGRLKEVSCRVALLELHRLGVIRLPAAETSCFRRSRPERRPEPLVVPELTCALADVGAITITPVSSRYSKASRVWNALMDRFHYLGKGPLCGGQIRYVVESAAHGVVGALAFSAAQWRLKKRDQYIGWTEAARRAHLPLVVCNSRFLILPTVHVPNLASHVLSQCLRRLADDWAERYGYTPVLVETFVDPSRFVGTCYQAANWVHVGQTAAEDTAYPNGKVSGGPKDIYVYPLTRDWQHVLGVAPTVALGTMPRPEAPAGWVEEEFGGVQLFDARLASRLCTLAADFFAQPGALIPQACSGSAAKTKAAYRFFQNGHVDLQTLLRPHVESTIARLRAHRVILAVQDTTSLNYTAHPPDGVGPINNGQNSAVGLELHDTLAFTPEGTPLGLLNVQCWARDPHDVGKKHRRHQLPIEAKESYKWLASYRALGEIQKSCPDTLLVSVGDREADLYERFADAALDRAGPQILVRAERTRHRTVLEADQKEALWTRMAREPLAGVIEISVPRRGSRLGRTARLEVRYASGQLPPPSSSTRLPVAPLRMWAVSAREIGAGVEVAEPIDWMLVTSVKTARFEEACERLRWYSRRWGIEVYHRTIKSGCRIEDRRLDDAHGLQACLAIDLVVAWRVYWLTMVGRATPETPCRQILSDDEWRVLSAWATGQLGETAPSAHQAMHWLGQLGGWLRRGPPDHPGTTCMWRGLVRLPNMVAGYRLALQIHGVRAGP